MRRKKNIVIISMCLAVLLMIVGYAAFQTRLMISGMSNITGAWGIEITNISGTATGAAYDLVAPAYSGTQATIQTGLRKPGDKMTYSITVKNTGTIDAIIEEVSITTEGSNVIIYGVSGLQSGVRLNRTKSITFTLTVEFDPNATSIPSDNTKVIDINILAIQDDGQSVTPSNPSIDQSMLLSTKILNDNMAQADTSIDFSQISSDTNGKGLYYTSTNTQDNKKTYYFRGAVTNNYIEFGTYKEAYSYFDNVTSSTVTVQAGTPIVWRIVRVNEDGSVRLIKQDSIGYYLYNGTAAADNADIGYMYGATNANTYLQTHANNTNSVIKGVLDTWYLKHLSTYSSFLSTKAGFCNDRSVATTANTWESDDTALGYGKNITYYGAYNRIYKNNKPQFKCPNETNDLFTLTTSSKGNKKLTNPIGLLTMDEVIYAGGKVNTGNSNYYLVNGDYWWTMTPINVDITHNTNVGFIEGNGSVSSIDVDISFSTRPVINLKGDVTVEKGDGTIDNPYVIDTKPKKTLVTQILKDNEEQSDTNINFSQISSDTNGKGLYYTSTDTENNGTTYYFRGNVENNYVSFGTRTIDACMYNGNELYYNDNILVREASVCSQSNVCYVENGYRGHHYFIVPYGESECSGRYGGVLLSDQAVFLKNVQDMLWRIIRINEDGSIRLIYNQMEVTGYYNNLSSDQAHFGYMYGTAGSNTYLATHKNINNSTIKNILDEWYSTNLSSYSNFLAKDAGFCNDRSIAPKANVWAIQDTALGYGSGITYYGSYNRLVNLKKPQFKCPQTNDLFTWYISENGNKMLTNPIGTLTADEAVYAGGAMGVDNTNYYLQVDSFYWTMTPYAFSPSVLQPFIAFVDTSGDLSSAQTSATSSFGIRPVINLKSTVEITGGNGTSTSPYVIKTK